MQLPVELWILILSYVEERDLFAMGCTSRLLRTLVLPLLYETVDRMQRLTYDNGARPLKGGWRDRPKIFKLLQSPGIATIVLDLRLSLCAFFLCPRLTPDGRFRRLRRCACNEIDKQAGEGMKAMVNLEALQLDCDLCMDGSSRRHHYMADLLTRKLRHLSLLCCCSLDTHHPLEKVLSAPVQATVEAWKWNTRFGPISRVMEKILDNDQTLPRLRMFCHNGTTLDNILLGSRPIERIYIGNIPVSVHRELFRAFEACPGQLTHAIVTSLGLLARVYAITPAPFTNLRHIGTIPLFAELVVCVFVLGF